MSNDGGDRPQTPLDYRTARDLPREEAGFYYRGSSEVVTEGVIFFPTQGNCTAFLCDGRIFLVDTTPAWFAPGILADLRSNHSKAPLEAIAYTHGHIDHVTGAATFLTEAEEHGYSRPRIIAHQDVARRFDRYRLLHEQNNFINRVQFNLTGDARPFSTVT